MICLYFSDNFAVLKVHVNPYVFSLSVTHKDFVLWTETGSSNGLHVAYKDSGQKIRGVIHPKVGQAGPVITYDKSSQPTVPGKNLFSV